MTSVHGPSPSAPISTNLNIQATPPPSAREQTRRYPIGRRTPKLATVPAVLESTALASLAPLLPVRLGVRLLGVTLSSLNTKGTPANQQLTLAI